MGLSHSTQCYEVRNEQQRASEIARRAFDEALEHLDELNDAHYRDATAIMQLLRDNLTLWTQEHAQNKKEAVILIDGFVRKMRKTLKLSQHIALPNIINHLCVKYYIFDL